MDVKCHVDLAPESLLLLLLILLIRLMLILHVYICHSVSLWTVTVAVVVSLVEIALSWTTKPGRRRRRREPYSPYRRIDDPVVLPIHCRCRSTARVLQLQARSAGANRFITISSNYSVDGVSYTVQSTRPDRSVTRRQRRCRLPIYSLQVHSNLHKRTRCTVRLSYCHLWWRNIEDLQQ